MTSIQKKIWLLAVIVVLIMASIWMSLTFYNQKMQDQYNDILERYLVLNEIRTSSQKTVTALNDYLLLPSPENLNTVNISMQDLQTKQEEVVGFKNIENEFELTSYINLLASLVEVTDRALVFHSEEGIENARSSLNEATYISNYLSEMTLSLIDSELSTYDQFYRAMIDQSEKLNRLGIWLLLLITFLLLLYTYWFSLRITKPLEKLTRAASELSRGRFDLKIEVDSKDEMAFLARMFEHMRTNINKLIIEIQQKAQLEKELQESKLLLKESQLHSLQSQINPHFLFNTLNTVSKKAYLEGSEETSDLLVSIAGLLRYNLKHLDKTMTLCDEVNVLKQYMIIQKARFTDRLSFETDIEESCLDIAIPGLTLQPIVENAIMYAVEPCEAGGNIWFSIKDTGDRVMIKIEDNGPGIHEMKINRILNEEVEQESKQGQSSGIGLYNVVRRLRLFTGNRDVIKIEGKEGIGTKVTIELLKARGVANDVQSAGG
ncbi:HAMP domain-containing protein [Rossellomorea vietnamensis]|uniref:histidine kinase n=2 Tax=Rossellomorea TaxID=2837508 RepID=A0A5D4KEK0_9BACI|nr:MULTISPECIES: histidine kinase [Rossellomorea]TYR75155.1 HAMP domain-containing protein [Rossellomorea vietnamensis]TYS79911.1 HAMP domain-containing protein [Rossellomorea aquimaris]